MSGCLTVDSAGIDLSNTGVLKETQIFLCFFKLESKIK